MSQNIDLLILSDCVLDAYYSIESLPVKADEAVASEEPYFYPGGGCNVAIVASKLGLRVAVVDRLGKDCFSQILVKELEKEGVKTDMLRFDVRHYTSVSNNVFDRKGRHAFIGYAGAGAYLSYDDVERAIVSSKAVFFDGYNLDPRFPAYRAIKNAVEKAKGESKQVFFDPGPRKVEDIKSFIRASSTVFFNKKEMLMHIGDSYRNSIKKLKKDVERSYVIKLGKRGSLCIYDGKTVRIKAIRPEKVIHTIGAGDAFDATFIAFTLKGYSKSVSCMYASLMASLKLGTKHVGELPGLERFLKMAEMMGIESVKDGS